MDKLLVATADVIVVVPFLSGQATEAELNIVTDGLWFVPALRTVSREWMKRHSTNSFVPAMSVKSTKPMLKALRLLFLTENKSAEPY